MVDGTKGGWDGASHGLFLAGMTDKQNVFCLSVAVAEVVKRMGYPAIAGRASPCNDLMHGFELGRGNHHTNTIEGHWSHFKCAVRGTHVQISAKQCGNMSLNLPIGATSANRARLCLIALWPLSRCHVYKTFEILSVQLIGVRLGRLSK
jgi:hypothetical protein